MSDGKELVKGVRRTSEDYKVRIRTARRDANDMLKEVDGLPEDDLHRGRDEVQKRTDSWIAKVDALADQKEKEILEV